MFKDLNLPLRIILITLLNVLAGCGYTFQGSGSILPPDVKKIYIPTVENNSTEISLTNLVTESIRDRFERFGVVTVVDTLNEADAVLSARILKVKNQTKSTTTRTDTAQQQDTILTMTAQLQRVSGPILWRDANFSVSRGIASTREAVVSSSADFATSGLSGSADLGALDSREVSRSQQQEALQNLADLVARKIYDEAVAPDF